MLIKERNDDNELVTIKNSSSSWWSRRSRRPRWRRCEGSRKDKKGWGSDEIEACEQSVSRCEREIFPSYWCWIHVEVVGTADRVQWVAGRRLRAEEDDMCQADRVALLCEFFSHLWLISSHLSVFNADFYSSTCVTLFFNVVALATAYFLSSCKSSSRRCVFANVIADCSLQLLSSRLLITQSGEHSHDLWHFGATPFWFVLTISFTTIRGFQWNLCENAETPQWSHEMYCLRKHEFDGCECQYLHGDFNTIDRLWLSA